MEEFKCLNCNTFIGSNDAIGTKHRNHCPICLFSKHVDCKPGDRKSKCGGKMKPVALTFKKEGKDRYGKVRVGELMIVNICYIFQNFLFYSFYLLH